MLNSFQHPRLGARRTRLRIAAPTAFPCPTRRPLWHDHVHAHPASHTLRTPTKLPRARTPARTCARCGATFGDLRPISATYERAEMIRVVAAAPAHFDAWATMRTALWPDQAVAAHRAELDALTAAADGRHAAFIAIGADGTACGFAEAALRSDYVESCTTSPVVFLEGIYVAPAARRSGVARALSEAVAEWGHSHGCREYASDAYADNAESIAFHRALGFAASPPILFFHRSLQGTP